VPPGKTLGRKVEHKKGKREGVEGKLRMRLKSWWSCTGTNSPPQPRPTGVLSAAGDAKEIHLTTRALSAQNAPSNSVAAT